MLLNINFKWVLDDGKCHKINYYVQFYIHDWLMTNAYHMHTYKQWMTKNKAGFCQTPSNILLITTRVMIHTMRHHDIILGLEQIHKKDPTFPTEIQFEWSVDFYFLDLVCLETSLSTLWINNKKWIAGSNILIQYGVKNNQYMITSALLDSY